jgi:hypothetical protein
MHIEPHIGLLACTTPSRKSRDATRYRNPSAWTRRHSASAGRVSVFRFARITRRTAAVDGHDPPSTAAGVFGVDVA